ncbi:MAG: PspC domain-containing protein [Thermicanus sp.]|nr:PspC domain-containing protein [Thermicanus sp.]
MKLYRSRRDRMLTGLCGGLAELLNVDSTIIRLLVVITAFFSGGTIILLYFLASLVIPNEPMYETGYGPRYRYGYGPDPEDERRYGTGWNDGCGYRDDRRREREERREARRERREERRRERGAEREWGKSDDLPPADNKIDEMMEEIERKALEREIAELKAKLAKYERLESEKNEKGE